MTPLKKSVKFGWSAVFAGSVAIWCLALAGIANAQGVTLGAAANFALLSDAGPMTLGNSAVILGVSTNVGATYSNIKIGGNNTKINGDVIATLFENGPGATISLANYAHVLGACVTDGGAITLGSGATCGSQDTTNTNPDITMIGNAVDQEENFDQAVSCEAPTQSIAAIAPAAGKTQTIALSAGLNVISTPSVAMGNSSVLILKGGSTDSVILETAGSFSMGFGAKIVLQGGLMAQNVFITTTTEPAGFNPPASPPSVFINNSSVIYGTVHGGDTCTLGSGVTINGAMICDYGLTTGPNLKMNFAPATGLSLPGCGV
ncbi:MAG: hypothetical protein IVW56_11155 [Candidatus Binataceae bacterium]|nr:hypothetical protein [Candidatus Binataceae bacterium]